jgi:starvation-inducible DNA-binding protein
MGAIDIGINEQDRINIAEGLKRLLADSYTLYLQTHNFHWNVTGPQFRELHLMFEEHYTELAVAVDDIAERIRTLDVAAPGTYRAFAGLSSIEEVDGVPSATEMIERLTRGHEQVVKTGREVLARAQGADDESTAALVSDRMRVHEKTAWMLRAMQ